MTSPASEHTLINYLLIPHPKEDAVLMLGGQSSPQLPAFIPEEENVMVVRALNQVVFEMIGIHVTTLQYFRGVTSKKAQSIARYFAMDNIDLVTNLSGKAIWVNVRDLPQVLQDDPGHVAIIKSWNDWMKLERTTRLRVPWARRGWFARAEDWVIDLADRLDLPITENVIQERVWSRACTLYLNTGDGGLYFKATHPVFSYEAVITRVLFLRYRNYIPEVMAVNVEEGWLLLREFDAAHLSDAHRVEIWEQALRIYASMQMDLIGATHTLVALGVPDRNVDFLVSQIDGMMTRIPDDFDDEERHALFNLAPVLRQYCYDLVNFEIPLTLTHGEFQPDNIAIKKDHSPLFFDWSDCVITHPFFDVAHFLAMSEGQLPAGAGVRQRLIRAYLQPWSDRLPVYELLQAFALAEVVYHLHRVTMFQDLVMPVLDSVDLLDAETQLATMMRKMIASAPVNQS